MPPELGFSFLQAIVDRLRRPDTPVLIGYLSIRICPPTNTLMGMQQFGEQSVMIEPVGFRTPASRRLFASILADLAQWNADFDTGGMLHWGLETDGLDRDRFENSAVTRPFRPGSRTSKLVAFKAVRALLHGDHPRVFDNHFVRRLGLDDYQCELLDRAQAKRGLPRCRSEHRSARMNSARTAEQSLASSPIA